MTKSQGAKWTMFRSKSTLARCAAQKRILQFFNEERQESAGSYDLLCSMQCASHRFGIKNHRQVSVVQKWLFCRHTVANARFVPEKSVFNGALENYARFCEAMLACPRGTRLGGATKCLQYTYLDQLCRTSSALQESPHLLSARSPDRTLS